MLRARSPLPSLVPLPPRSRLGGNVVLRSNVRSCDLREAVWGIFIAAGATPPSISQTHVHNVLQQFALLKPGILVQKEKHRLILPVGRVVGAVRRQQDILQLVQWMSRRQRL